MAKEKKLVRAEPAVPTINPITGKEFANEAERTAFVDEQKVKLDQMRATTTQRQDARLSAADKIMAIFTSAGVTEEEVKLVFGHRMFR